MAKSQKVDSEKELTRLELRHKKLGDRVAEYEARAFLSPSERTDLAKLKKQKLATKDALSGLRSNGD